MDLDPKARSRGTDLATALQQVSSQPLWDRYQRITRRQPTAPGTALHWPWAALEPLVARAVAEVDMADAERRVLLLTDENLPAAATTRNLLGGLQTLMPGERAHPHRHTIAALRFVMQGLGACTSVNDESCPMAPGDLVLTPAWTWHGHRHEGTQRVVWFDGLDLPLCAHLDTMFFEPAGPSAASATATAPVPTRPTAPWPQAVTLGPDAQDSAGGSRFRYAAHRARAALAATAPREDGSRLLRYGDGESGGPALPSLDCGLLQLAPHRPTWRRRSTAAAVCVVAEGSGRSRIGEQALRWSRHDVFTVPHWQWVRHEADAGGATLFVMTDRSLLDGLAYLRDEASPD